MQTMTIVGKDARIQADVSTVEDGIRVEIWRRSRADNEVWSLQGDYVFDKPWHIVVDKVHETIQGQ